MYKPVNPSLLYKSRVSGGGGGGGGGRGGGGGQTYIDVFSRSSRHRTSLQRFDVEIFMING